MTQNVVPKGSGPAPAADAGWPVSGRSLLIAGLLIILAAILAGGWLVPVVLAGGSQLSETRVARNENARTVAEFLTRDAGDLGLDMGEVVALYATPQYFRIADKASDAALYAPDQFLVFFISEDIHHGELPLAAPEARLRLGAGREYSAHGGTQVISDAEHHRTSVARFPLTDAEGRSLLAGAAAIDLVLRNPESRRSTATTTVRWDLPIEYPDSLQGGKTLTAGTLLALVAGLLAALSPCLAQLTACYLTTLAGVGARQAGDSPVAVRGRVLRTAVLFVVGFTAVYTLAGATAGFAGQAIQSSGLIVRWSGPLGVVSGVLLVGMGLWVAINARAPLVCRLPMPTFMRLSQKGGVLGPMIMGSAFALGCATCFSGALFAALLLYLGTTATALQGATILFIFSLGIGVPYLLAAASLSRALPVLDRLGKMTPLVGLVSGLVIIGFGLLMLTGNFHAVSDEVYVWLRWMRLLG
ncbi:MAG: hypothetical protein HZB53_13955 [Chloroflexi bacterium]|nr:hypothetical protein [Chloroflexota bacterium]